MRARREAQDQYPRIGLAEADLLLGCDLVAAAEKDSVLTLDAARSRAVINSYLQPTAAFQHNPDVRLDVDAELAAPHAVRFFATGLGLMGCAKASK